MTGCQSIQPESTSNSQYFRANVEVDTIEALNRRSRIYVYIQAFVCDM